MTSVRLSGAARRLLGSYTVGKEHINWTPRQVATKKRGLIDWSQDQAMVHFCTACSDTIKQLKATAKSHGTIKQDTDYSGRSMCDGCSFATAQLVVTYTKKQTTDDEDDEVEAVAAAKPAKVMKAKAVKAKIAKPTKKRRRAVVDEELVQEAVEAVIAPVEESAREERARKRAALSAC